MMEFGYEIRRGSKRDEQGSGYGDVRIIHVIGDCPPVIVSDGLGWRHVPILESMFPVGDYCFSGRG